MDAEERLSRDVQIVRESLSLLPEPVVRPALVVLSGLPGTGKTHFARQLLRAVPLAWVQSDAVRRLLYRRPTYTFRESEWVFRVCHRLLEDLLSRGVGVIFDATNLTERNRESLYRIADRTGARLIVVQLVAPSELIRQRLEARAAHPEPSELSEATWEVYERMLSRWEPISRPHFVVDTSKDVEQAVARIAREVARNE